jgi:hypothetical protein
LSPELFSIFPSNLAEKINMSDLESRDAIVTRASKGLGPTPFAPQGWCTVERQTMLELLGAAVEIRDAINRVAAALESANHHQGDKP